MPQAIPYPRPLGPDRAFIAKAFCGHFKNAAHARIGSVFQPKFQRIHLQFCRHDIDLRFTGENVNVCPGRAPCANVERMDFGRVHHPTPIRAREIIGHIVKHLGASRSCAIDVIIEEADLAGAINARLDLAQPQRAGRNHRRIPHRD